MIKIFQPQCFSAPGEKPNQEDSLYPPCGKATANTRIFMVCDGMGGHENGEVASACVAETIGQITETLPLSTTEQMKEAFEQALAQAYHNLDELDDGQSSKKMGTTLTFLALCTDGILVAHIGDSRVYQFRPGSGIIFQTRDHSLVNDLISSGELSQEEARTFPQRNVITRAIQPHQEFPAKASYKVLTDIRRGDLFMLCCDGVLEQLEDQEITEILLNDIPLAKRIDKLEATCKARKTHDNNSAYLIEVSKTDNSGMEDIVLTIATEDEQNDQDPPTLRMKQKCKWWNIHKLWIILSLAFMAFILAFIFFCNPCGSEKNEGNAVMTPSQTIDKPQATRPPSKQKAKMSPTSPPEETTGYIRRQRPQ